VVLNGDGECSTVAASLGGSEAQANWRGPKVGGRPALVLHSSDEPGELLQWLCHDDFLKMSNLETSLLLFYISLIALVLSSPYLFYHVI